MEDAREWSNETTMYFLECYQSEPIIWDPKHLAHKDKKKVNDAWGRISQVMSDMPIGALKKKKDGLMATFRNHLRRKKASIKSGAGANDIYTPIWQFYDTMEEFLAPVYDCNRTANTEREDPVNTQDLNFETEMPGENNENEDPLASSTSSTPTNQTTRRRKHPPELVTAEKQMNAAMETLNSVLNKQQSPEDDCDIYAKLLAKRLKSLPESQKEYFMFKTDQLWWSLRSTSDYPSPDNFRPSSAQSTHYEPTQYSSRISYSQVPTPNLSSKSSVSSHSSYFPVSHNAQINADNYSPLYTPDNASVQQALSSPEMSYVHSIPGPSTSHSSHKRPIPPTKKIHVLTDVPLTRGNENLINKAYMTALNDYDAIENNDGPEVV